jgi:hypothetical protein
MLAISWLPARRRAAALAALAVVVGLHPAGPAAAEAFPARAQCAPDSYVNVDGACVHDPEYSDTVPPDATARCNDGTYSFSLHRRGTCSHHGGVAQYLDR